MRNIKLFRYIKDLYFRYLDDEVPALSAQMAYFFLLAVFPFLIFLVTIIAYSPISSEDVLEPISNVLPYESYMILRKNVQQVTHSRNLKLLSIGLITALWAASNGVGAVINGINRAYGQRETRPFWKIKLVSILFTIALSMMILFYFVLLIFGHKIGNAMINMGVPSGYREVWDNSRYVVIIVMMVIVFAALYHYTPCLRLRWREVVLGAIFTTISWLVISLGFSYYVNEFWNFTLVYGSLGGIVALLIWLYLSATMIIMGGEINAVLSLSREGKRRYEDKKH